MALFCAWLRSRVHLTAMSEGMCRMRTPVSTWWRQDGRAHAQPTA